MTDERGDPFRPVASHSARRPLLMLAGSAALLFGFFLLMGELTVRHHPWWSPDQSWSHRIFDFAHDRPWLTTLSEWIGHVTVPTVLRIVTLLCAVLLWRRAHRTAALFFSLTVVLGGFLAIAARELVARPRPHWPGSGPPVEGYTFPSGHACSAALFAGCAVIVVWPFLRNTGRALATAAGLLFTVLVGLSRLFLGVHSVLDVAAAWLFAAVLILIAIALSVSPTVHRWCEALAAKVGVRQLASRESSKL